MSLLICIPDSMQPQSLCSALQSLDSGLKIDIGSAYGTAKSSVGICSMGVLRPDLILKSVVPVIMAGILGVYGLIVGVILA